MAALGHEVLALEPSEEMREACATTLAEPRRRDRCSCDDRRRTH
ncbi:MAG: hypothetical protein WKF58_04100 [Ilumatobacteraceae bacterium]